MSFSWRKAVLVTLLSCHLSLLPSANAQCTKFYVRQQWRELSNNQRTNYVNAVASLYRNNPQVYVKFASDHNNLGGSGIHGNGMFLPWHRHFLMTYEAALRTQRADITLAYWDSTLDNSPSFGTALVFGATGFGAYSTSTCVSFGGITLRDGNNCVTRGGRWSAFQSTSQVNSFIVNSNDYNTFSRAVELGIHNGVHVVVGGNMATFRSPIDPLFFLHHCLIDKLWAQWQSRNFNTRITTDYGWKAPLSGFGAQFESVNSYLPNYNVQVKNVLDISALCYRYSGVPVKPGSNAGGINTPGLVRRALDDELDKKAPCTQSAPRYADKEPYLDAIVDLGELCAVPVPEPLPESWLRTNLLNVTEVREYEARSAALATKLNELEGYLPPLAPISNTDSLKQRIEGVNGKLKQVFFSLYGKQYNVPFGPDCTATVNKIVDVAKKLGHVGKPQPTMEQLAAIIGEPAFPRGSPSNPFRMCRETPKDPILYGEAPAPKRGGAYGGY